MAYTIFKYELHPSWPNVMMPADSQILSVQAQNEKICVWALVDTERAIDQRIFRVYGTGHNIENPDRLRFIGTCQLSEGSLVLHVFEQIRFD